MWLRPLNLYLPPEGEGGTKRRMGDASTRVVFVFNIPHPPSEQAAHG